MNRGALIWINLGDASPPEFGKLRPALILSNTEHNLTLDSVVVVPISSRPSQIWPLRLRLARLLKGKEGYAVVPGIRQVNKSRLMDVAGHLNAEAMAMVDEAVSAYLGE